VRRLQIWLLQFALRWIERTLEKRTGVKRIIVLCTMPRYYGIGQRQRKRRLWYLRRLLNVSRLWNVR
jgi:hypothetical protein